MAYGTKCGENISDIFITEEDLVDSLTIGHVYRTGASYSAGVVTCCTHADDLLCSNAEKLFKGTTGSHTAFIQCNVGGSTPVYRLSTSGNNNFGQLGNFTIVSNTSCVFPIDCANWVDAATGSVHTLAVRVDGSLWSWGRNNCSQLGDPDAFLFRSSPIQVSASGWKKVAAGEFNSFAISSNNGLYAWGKSDHGQSGIISVSNTTLSVPLFVGNDYKCVVAGSDYALALKTDNTIWTWGYNVDGRLGLGDTISRSSPVQICSGSGKQWKKISAGHQQAAAIDIDGNIYVWGCNKCSNLGLGTTVPQMVSCPVQISSSLKWRDVSINCQAGGAVSTEGLLYIWGVNACQMLGLNCTVTTLAVPNPTLICNPLGSGSIFFESWGTGGGEVESVNVNLNSIYFITRSSNLFKY